MTEEGDYIRETLREFCERTDRGQLLRQWHPARNAPLTPDDILPGSHRMVWWVCERGHEWRAMVKARAAGSGCPVCTNRSVRTGFNDLATTHPALAAEWHPTKNGTLTPRGVTAGSRKKVWWLCGRGHEWQVSVISRTSNRTGCPVCAGKIVVAGVNDLASSFPDIAAEWDSEKNGELCPCGVTPYSNRKVWWRCPMGHSYQAVIASRTTRGSGCPYCSGRKIMPGFNDLATMEPHIAAQWHPTLNRSLTPEMVTVGSNKKVWWKCPEGHVWQAVVYSRTGRRRTGCPVCSGTSVYRHSRILPARYVHGSDKVINPVKSR